MPVRTHAPECAKTLALRIEEDTGIGAVIHAHACTCGARYERGPQSIEEMESEAFQRMADATARDE